MHGLGIKRGKKRSTMAVASPWLYIYAIFHQGFENSPFFVYQTILQFTKCYPVIYIVNHVFNKSLRYQMMFATLKLKLLTTFSRELGILLIPGLWMKRLMNFLDVFICCKSRLMGIWDKSISWPHTLSFFVVVMSTLPVSRNFSINHVAKTDGGFIKIFIEPSSGYSWENTWQKHRTISNPLSHRNCSKQSILLLIGSTVWQEISYVTQNGEFGYNNSWKIQFQ